jgi:hypothetical protein
MWALGMVKTTVKQNTKKKLTHASVRNMQIPPLPAKASSPASSAG